MQKITFNENNVYYSLLHADTKARPPSVLLVVVLMVVILVGVVTEVVTAQKEEGVVVIGTEDALCVVKCLRAGRDTTTGHFGNGLFFDRSSDIIR